MGRGRIVFFMTVKCFLAVLVGYLKYFVSVAVVSILPTDIPA